MFSNFAVFITSCNQLFIRIEHDGTGIAPGWLLNKVPFLLVILSCTTILKVHSFSMGLTLNL